MRMESGVSDSVSYVRGVVTIKPRADGRRVASMTSSVGTGVVLRRVLDGCQ